MNSQTMHPNNPQILGQNITFLQGVNDQQLLIPFDSKSKWAVGFTAFHPDGQTPVSLHGEAAPSQHDPPPR